jgi:hypothetical protein
MSGLLLFRTKEVGRQQNGPRRGADRSELPGLVAAAKKQAANHDGSSLTDPVAVGQPDPTRRAAEHVQIPASRPRNLHMIRIGRMRRSAPIKATDSVVESAIERR